MRPVIRSPFFYVGDKYKLMPQLQQVIPKDLEYFIEPFVGGGSSFLNIKSQYYLVNDVNPYVIQLHQFMNSYKDNLITLINELYDLIDYYQLSCSYRGLTVPDDLKKSFVKTYYAKYNKAGYLAMRDDFNHNQTDMHRLYLLLIYGFNHMIRFNASGKFNLPVGNVDFNKNVYHALQHYMHFMQNNQTTFFNHDYQEFLNLIDFNNKENSYVFLDPPYLISMSEYNKLWDEEKEQALCQFLDALHQKGIRFGITNLIHHKDKFNQTFFEWSQKYITYDIQSNYISFHDNTIKTTSKEIFVTNYEVK